MSLVVPLPSETGIKTLKASDLLRMVRTYEAWAHSICAPIFWGDGKGNTRNGSMTFLRTEQQVLGITNAHVADAVAGCTEEIGHQCQVGGAYLDPSWLIAKHPSMDLATFRLSDIVLSQTAIMRDGSIGDSKHQAATVRTWPPALPSDRSPVMYGGYPGAHRTAKPDGNLEFGFFWFANQVQSISDTNVGMVINVDHSISVGSKTLPAGADLGGWSGGPVFRVVEENKIERLELAAIIYEYSSSTGIVFSHPLTDLKPDGTFG